MNGWFIRTEGSATTVELREVPQPSPAPGQVLVRVRAAGLNRGEFIPGGLTKAGAAKPCGQEAAGEIVATGERVMGRCAGAFAEYALMDAREAIPIPPGLSFEEAACIPLAFMVVHDMLVTHGSLKAGEWLLVTGVASGVGVAALQAAKAGGAKVIGTSGSATKLERLRAIGLDVGLPARRDFAQAVVDATGGKGANLVVNNVGGSVFAECVKAAAYEGRLAVVGYVDRTLKAEIDIEAVHVKRLRIFGVSNKLRPPEERAQSVRGFVADYLPLFASGRIKPLLDRAFAFADLPAAQRYMESDAHVGKVVLTVP